MKLVEQSSPSGRYRAGFALLAGCLLLAGCQTGMNNMITVRAQAAPAYAAAHAGPVPSAPPQTYVFTKGPFFRSIFDANVRKVDFDALARMLSTGLRPRYVPAPDPNKADLVLVVHWGAVERPDNSIDNLMLDPDAIRAADQGVADAKASAAAAFSAGNYTAWQQVAAAESNLNNQVLQTGALVTADAQVAASRAEMIGLGGVYAPDPGAADSLQALLEDDRYVVTVIALDAAALRQGRKDVVWTTRMSVPVAGRDFATAVREMDALASPLYGTAHPGLVVERAASRPGETAAPETIGTDRR